jgi:hypothetical protein
MALARRRDGNAASMLWYGPLGAATYTEEENRVRRIALEEQDLDALERKVANIGTQSPFQLFLAARVGQWRRVYD